MNSKACSATRRLPAEWEPQHAVLLSWPHENSDWCDMLPWVHSCYVKLAAAISEIAEVIVIAPDTRIARTMLDGVPTSNHIRYIDVPTNDTWTRDFGPITIEDCGKPALLDFCFNGWGMKFAADKDNLVTDNMSRKGVFKAPVINNRGFVLEGGSIESDGEGTILTTAECLLSPNRNAGLSRAEIEEYLKTQFGASRVIWLENGALAGDDTDSHVDTLARLAPDNTIVYVKPPADKTDMHFATLSAMAQELQLLRTTAGEPYRLIGLPLPDPIFDADGNRLPATYANYLPLNNTLLVPVYGQPDKDNEALCALKSAFPTYNIKPIDCTALIQQHGSLHCATMQIPHGVIK